MAEPFIGEIKLWAQPWAPQNWAICDGTLLKIVENQALYFLLGTKYGGDGKTTFALPDLRGRIAVGWDGYEDGIYALGERYGFESITLNSTQMPAHNHAIRINDAPGDRGYPNDNLDFFSNNGEDDIDERYADAFNTTTLAPETMPSLAGSGLAHSNIQPSIVGTYCICIKGLFPERN